MSTLLSNDAFRPLPDAIARRMEGMDPALDVVFLVRVAVLAPAIYRSAKLLDAMHGRTLVPIILFYPGSLDGEHSLRFMGLAEGTVYDDQGRAAAVPIVGDGGARG